MERTMKLRIRDEKTGNYNEYFNDFVAQSKKLEYIRKEVELENKLDDEGNRVLATQADYDEMQAEFVASLFTDKKVTKESILAGIDTLDFTEVYDIIKYRVMTMPKKEVDELKKKMTEELLHGRSSTTSKSNLPET